MHEFIKGPRESVVKEELDILKWIPEIGDIKDDRLREMVISVWRRLWSESKFENIADVPIRPPMDPPYPHMIHNRSVVQMAIKVAEVLHQAHGTEINMDHLIAAAALQDSSKVIEYEPGPEGTVYSERGQMFQHAFYAAHAALDEGLPDGIVQAIFSHTFEASKFPQTLIAKILFYVDQVDMAAVGGDRWRKSGVLYR
jgi:hypothetical protein